MPTITDQAIVIRQWDFSETSQTVSLFTRDHGVIRGLAKGSRREKGSFSGGLDVLTGGQIVAIIKPGRDLATLTAWHVQQMYPAVRKSLPANRAAQYMADLIHHMIIDHDPHPAVFEALTHALDELGDDASIDASLLAFQWRLLRECGYEPQVDRDAASGGDLPANAVSLTFSAAAGGLVSGDPSPLSDSQDQEKHDIAHLSTDRSMIEYDRRQSSNNQVGHGQPITGSWRVRMETVRALQTVAAGKALSDIQGIGRANRLLAVYIRELLGHEPAAMRWAFSDLTSKSQA